MSSERFIVAWLYKFTVLPNTQLRGSIDLQFHRIWNFQLGLQLTWVARWQVLLEVTDFHGCFSACLDGFCHCPGIFPPPQSLISHYY